MTEVFTDVPQSPGSIRDFAARRGYDSTDGRVWAEYNAELAQYRINLAEARGITLDELHHGPLVDIGKVATSSFSSATSQSETA